MSNSEESRPIFPLVDRPAPVLERIRDNRQSQPAEEFGEKVGRELVMLSKLDGEEKEEVKDSIIAGMAEGVADSTGVDREEVNLQNIESIADALFSAEGRLVDLPDDLTVDEVDEEDEEDDDSSFSDDEE